MYDSQLFVCLCLRQDILVVVTSYNLNSFEIYAHFKILNGKKAKTKNH